MADFYFYLFAALMLGGGLGVVVNRNPVTSALCLVGSFLGLASLFIQIDAFFIGTIQVLVYAGAVMVLFLFIIMLLDVAKEEKRPIPVGATAAGALVAALVGWQVMMLVDSVPMADQPLPKLELAAAGKARADALGPEAAAKDKITARLTATSPTLPDIHLVGESLFTRYNLHLQVAGVILVVAILGVVVLSKRRLE